MNAIPKAQQLSPSLQRAFSLLRQAAQAGRPCPSNLEIAQHCDEDYPVHGARLVKALEAAGLVRVARGPNWRIVTIVYTGEMTTASSPLQGHLRRTAPPSRTKDRACLRCHGKFRSEGPHNRLCDTCRHYAAQASVYLP